MKEYSQRHPLYLYPWALVPYHILSLGRVILSARLSSVARNQLPNSGLRNKDNQSSCPTGRFYTNTRGMPIRTKPFLFYHSDIFNVWLVASRPYYSWGSSKHLVLAQARSSIKEHPSLPSVFFSGRNIHPRIPAGFLLFPHLLGGIVAGTTPRVVRLTCVHAEHLEQCLAPMRHLRRLAVIIISNNSNSKRRGRRRRKREGGKGEEGREGEKQKRKERHGICPEALGAGLRNSSVWLSGWPVSVSSYFASNRSNPAYIPPLRNHWGICSYLP